ncbi:gas vesicle protein [Streptomyces caniscabiei]|uniref:gas vesicle protein n=1 Tax=Streptomyces caniscabiei TaxID=2746961 RepID=UPI0029B5F76A|nr:gas vesicle protein GvpJ [Streptomyces caniscabiei]MDX2606618.1 gas vesicle protein [Streptomyces caniscabiei]MDX2739556.1 gas vesicle protein [Streptomyces caniscabiei]MDX2782453.1 gas vesicle protein [Streptomyces caniscabiei]
MPQSDARSPVPSPSRGAYPYGGGQGSSANLADILERVLDKGIVIVGDIKINLLDIELLTIKLRLLVASVDKAKEIGIDWWEHDPALSSRASRPDGGRRSLAEENERLRTEVKELRRRVEEPPPELSAGASAERPPREARRKEPRPAEPRPAEPRRKRRKPVNADDEDDEARG